MVSRPVVNGKKYIDEFLLDANNCNSVCYVSVSQDNIDVVYHILCKAFNCKKEDLEYRLGVIGVPITFMDKHNPDQFEIIGHEHDTTGNGGNGVIHGQFEYNGHGFYKRILIRKKVGA